MLEGSGTPDRAWTLKPGNVDATSPVTSSGSPVSGNMGGGAVGGIWLTRVAKSGLLSETKEMNGVFGLAKH
jgi:hypothetical protein